MKISNKVFTYSLITIAVITLLLSFYFGGAMPILYPINLIILLMIIAVWKFSYLFTPILSKIIRTEITIGEYKVLPSFDGIYRKVGDTYYVSKFLTANIYESTTEKTEEQKGLMIEYFERAITSFKYPVKISLLIRNIDLTKELDELRAERSRLETRKAHLATDNPEENAPQIAIIDRKIAMINKELERLTSGDRPMEVVSLIMTTASGASIDEARMKADAQAKEVQAVVGNALNVEVLPLSGNEMLKAFDFQYFIPSNTSEYTDMFEY